MKVPASLAVCFVAGMVLFATAAGCTRPVADGVAGSAVRSVYDFRVPQAAGGEVSLAGYKGKVLLIVNVASKCGFTKQYAGLQALYDTYRSKGLEILAFPCNQFKGQEPGTNEEIQTFCQTRFGVSFPVFAKIDVNGESAHPLYVHLKQAAPGVAGTEAVKWNFTKFLVARDGRVVERFSSATAPEELAPHIERLLAQ